MQSLVGLAAVFGLGFLYFVGAIPAGAYFDLPLVLVALTAWAGYSAGGLVIVLAGDRIRDFIKMRIGFDPSKHSDSFAYKIWDRYGIWAMTLIAPVTIGPQAGALLGLAMGAPRTQLVVAIAIGVLPYVIVFTLITALGVKIAE